jgi:hypothetical protein
VVPEVVGVKEVKVKTADDLKKFYDDCMENRWAWSRLGWVGGEVGGCLVHQAGQLSSRSSIRGIEQGRVVSRCY